MEDKTNTTPASYTRLLTNAVLGAAGLGFTVAAIVGAFLFAVGVATHSMEGLLGAYAGIVVGVIIGYGVYVKLVFSNIRRLPQRASSDKSAVTAILTPFIGPLAFLLLGRGSDADSWVGLVLAFISFFPVVISLVLIVGRAISPLRSVAVIGAALVLVTCTLAVDGHLQVNGARGGEASELASTYSSIQAWTGPMFLINGNSADYPDRAWKLAPPQLNFGTSYEDGEVLLSWYRGKFADSGDMDLTITMSPGQGIVSHAACPGVDCDVIASSKFGPVHRTGDHGQALIVNFAQGNLEVTSEDQLTVDQELALINSLVLVDGDTFASATARPSYN